MQTKMLRHEENRSSVYINLLDNEAKEWFGRIERFVENKRLMLNHNKIDKITNIKDLDALFEDFKQDRTQLCPTEERIKRYFLSTPPLAITIAKKKKTSSERMRFFGGPSGTRTPDRPVMSR